MAIKAVDFSGAKFEISYEFLNLDSQNPSAILVVLHGWGSNKDLMKGVFGDKFKNFVHLYVDLPGFGASSNSEILDSEKYAQILGIFWEQILAQNAKLQNLTPFFMGHSFGGKVATILVQKFGGKLILLSSSGIQIPKPLKVRAKIKLAKICKFFGVSNAGLRAADAQNLSQNMYETFKNVVAEDFSQKFQNLDSQAYIFWGKDDTATPLIIGETIHKLIKNSQFFVLEGDHYFFLKVAQNASFIESKVQI